MGQMKQQLADTAVVLKSRDEELARSTTDLKKYSLELTSAKVGLWLGGAC